MSMRSWFRLVVIAGVMFAALVGGSRAAHADQKGSFGLGLIIGEPTGVSGKLYLSDDTAIDAAIGGAVVGRGIHLHADFLWHPWILANEDPFVMPAYLGIGGRLLDHDRGNDDDDDFHLGARGVGGLLFDFRAAPIDVFVELALILDFRTGDSRHDGIGLDLNGGIGARYYF